MKTSRPQDIVRELRNNILGLPEKELAKKIGLSIRTLRNYIKNINNDVAGERFKIERDKNRVYKISLKTGASIKKITSDKKRESLVSKVKDASSIEGLFPGVDEEVKGMKDPRISSLAKKMEQLSKLKQEIRIILRNLDNEI